jgi:hypothetical protein
VGEEDVFVVHPQNNLNDLILNWCTGGCWFTPTPTLNVYQTIAITCQNKQEQNKSKPKKQENKKQSVNHH